MNAPVGAVIKGFSAAAKGRLIDLGWRKRAGDFYTFESGDFLGWLALGRSTKYAPLGIWPNVGVRHQPLELLVAQLRGSTPHPYDPVTVLTNVGYLTPRQSWYEERVLGLDDVARAADDVVATVERFGRPWIEGLFDLQALAVAVERHSPKPDADYRLPLLFWMVGEPKRGFDRLHAAVTDRDDRVDPEAVAFRSYSQAATNLMRGSHA